MSKYTYAQVLLQKNKSESSCTLALCSSVLALPCFAAVLVEKILRVQPDVKKIYLPVRAVDAATAKERVETEVCVHAGSSNLVLSSLITPN